MIVFHVAGGIAGAGLIDAGIDGELEHGGDVARREIRTAPPLDAQLAHLLNDVGVGRGAIDNGLVEALDVVCLDLDDLITALPVRAVAKRIGAAGVLAFGDGDLAAFDDLGGQVEGIILGHALHERLEDHGFRAVAKVLRDGD